MKDPGVYQGMSDNRASVHTGSREDRTGRESPLSASERCELLANDRRRALLAHLVARPGEDVAVEDLVSHLAANEAASEYRNIHLSLRHLHLPRLAEAGVVRYDTDRQRVEYVPARELEALLAFLEDDE